MSDGRGSRRESVISINNGGNPPKKREVKIKRKEEFKNEVVGTKSELVSLSSNNEGKKVEKKEKKRKSKSLAGSIPSNDASIIKHTEKFDLSSSSLSD